MWKLLLLVVGVGLLAFSFKINFKASPKKQLKSFRYNWYSGSEADYNKVYEAVEDGTGYVKLLIRDVDADGRTFTKTARIESTVFMQGLEELTQKRELHKWNCFKGYDSAKVNSNSFRLEASYTDGTVINAKSNSTPNGYGSAVNDIKNYFREQCK